MRFYGFLPTGEALDHNILKALQISSRLATYGASKVQLDFKAIVSLSMRKICSTHHDRGTQLCAVLLRRSLDGKLDYLQNLPL
jgi:hypothetical protein